MPLPNPRHKTLESMSEMANLTLIPRGFDLEDILLCVNAPLLNKIQVLKKLSGMVV